MDFHFGCAMNFDLQDPEMADAADEGAAPDSPAAPEMSSIEAIRCGEGRPGTTTRQHTEMGCKMQMSIKNPVFEIAFQDVFSDLIFN